MKKLAKNEKSVHKGDNGVNLYNVQFGSVSSIIPDEIVSWHTYQYILIFYYCVIIFKHQREAPVSSAPNSRLRSEAETKFKEYSGEDLEVDAFELQKIDP